MGMHDFINVKETPNKDMLASLSDVELAKLSCEKKIVDNISIKPKIEEIANPVAVMMQYILIFSGITLVFGILIYLLIQSGLSDLSEEQEARTCLIKGDIMMHNTTLQDFADKNERQNERIALEHNHILDHLETQLSSLHSQLVTLNSPLVTLSSSPRHSGLDPESSPSLASSERSEHGRQEPPPTHTPPRHSGPCIGARRSAVPKGPSFRA